MISQQWRWCCENITLSYTLSLSQLDTHLDWKTDSSRVEVVGTPQVVRPPSIPGTSYWDQLRLSSKKLPNSSCWVGKTTAAVDENSCALWAFESCLNLNLNRPTRQSAREGNDDDDTYVEIGSAATYVFVEFSFRLHRTCLNHQLSYLVHLQELSVHAKVTLVLWLPIHRLGMIRSRWFALDTNVTFSVFFRIFV